MGDKKLELRLYSSVDVVRYKYQGPTEGPEYYNRLKNDIVNLSRELSQNEQGIKYPLIIRWDANAQDFRPMIGNNRVAILHDLGKTHARALFLGPTDAEWPKAKYESLLFGDPAVLHSRLDELWAGHAEQTAPWQALVELTKP